jgi:hypothetical protein
MDTLIAEGVDNDEGNWELRKDTEFFKCWTRWEGTEFDQEIPVMRCEHYFPEIEDPNQILELLTKDRMKWDNCLKSMAELKAYTNKHVQVHHVVN